VAVVDHRSRGLGLEGCAQVTDMLRTAMVSECGRYRYALTRRWDAGALDVLFVLLNPSIADGMRDDPTVRKCVGFARRWALGGIRIANLFALRATDPKELHLAIKRGNDAVGPENLEHLVELAAGTSRVVLGWGHHAQHYPEQIERVVKALNRGPLCCLGTTDDGQPRHPLMPAYTTVLEPWVRAA
jgi:hypothetical protein